MRWADRVERNDFATKREAYYISKYWGGCRFDAQAESDAVMDDIEAMAGMWSPWSRDRPLTSSAFTACSPRMPVTAASSCPGPRPRPWAMAPSRGRCPLAP